MRILGDEDLRAMIIHEGGKRENAGITRYVNEKRQLKKHQQQSKMARSGHISVRSRQLKASSHDGARGRHTDGVDHQQTGAIKQSAAQTQAVPLKDS